MLIEMHKNAVFPLVNMEMEAFEQTLSLQKDGDGGFVKYQILVQLHIISKKKLNTSTKILQLNIFIHFKAIFNVIQR